MEGLSDLAGKGKQECVDNEQKEPKGEDDQRTGEYLEDRANDGVEKTKNGRQPNET